MFGVQKANMRLDVKSDAHVSFKDRLWNEINSKTNRTPKDEGWRPRGSRFSDIDSNPASRITDVNIHANYLGGDNPYCIATQYPTLSTLKDFFRICTSQPDPKPPVACIVGITRGADFDAPFPYEDEIEGLYDIDYYPKYWSNDFLENCDRYNHNLGFELTCKKDDAASHEGLFERYDLTLKFEGETSQEIPVIIVNNIPDYATDNIQNIESIVNEINKVCKTKGAGHIPLTHCRAGVGRTGLLMIAMKLMDSENKQSLKDLILEAREQRPLTVQTKEQFFTLYEIAEKYGINPALS